MSDFKYLSINQLSQLTGKDRRTITKKLADIKPIEGIGGKAKNYDSQEALYLIYQDNKGKKEQAHDGEPPNLTMEKVKLTRAQTEKIQLDSEKLRIQLKILEKELLPVEVVESVWANILGNFKSKVMAMPKKIAPVYKTWKSVKQAEKAIKKEVYECLNELSEFDDRDYHKEFDKKGYL